ncbi:hypothetical protein CG709_15630, partial [Lachnotalea glycerini]
MIEIRLDERELEKIEKKRGTREDDARNVLRKAINDTAKQARLRITKQAQLTYAARQGRFNKHMKIENARKASLVATIKATGEATELM